MANALQLQGQVFGSLTAKHRHGKDDHGSILWYCECLCGGNSVVLASALKLGRIKGCMNCRTVAAVKAHITHGKAGTRTYFSWKNMLNRCKPNHPRYADWGGRGIKVCDRWHKFENFLADMGEKPEGKSLDRINNDGNYEPGNCRWATALEQNQNQRPRKKKNG